MRCLAFKLTAALLLVAACTERTPLEPVEGKILVSYQCTDDGPTQPGCPVEWSFQEELETDVAQDVGLATGGEYLWQGESFAVAMEGIETSEKFCPSFYRPGKVGMYVIEFGEDAEFYRPGTAVLQGIIGRTVLGFPMARYAIPNQILTSSQPAGKYQIVGNITLYVVCNMVRFRTSAGRLVEGGFMRIYNVEADLRLAESGLGGGSPDRGWAWISGEEYRNGAGEGSDWRVVVDDFVENGDCTAGWEIWVDGVQTCDGT